MKHKTPLNNFLPPTNMTARLTIDRTHWGQKLCDLRAVPNLKELRSEETAIANAIWSAIPQYRKAAKALAATGWYRVSHLDYSASLFRWTASGGLDCIASHISKHRISQLMRHYDKYVAGDISADVWDNYATGGYTTRRGLMADYRSKEDRIHKIAMSHADCTEEGKAGHSMRAVTRNA